MPNRPNKPAIVHPLPANNLRLPLPPPPPPPPPPPLPKLGEPTCLTFCVIYFFLALLAIGSFTAFVVVISVLFVLSPHPEFRVDSFSIPNYNLTSTTTTLLSADFHVGLTVTNPNEYINVTYNHIEDAIYLGSSQISRTTLPAFFQSGKGETTIEAHFAAVRAYVDGEDKKGNLVFDLNMIIRVMTAVKPSIWSHFTIIPSCKGLSVRVLSNSSNESLVGGVPSLCRF